MIKISISLSSNWSRLIFHIHLIIVIDESGWYWNVMLDLDIYLDHTRCLNRETLVEQCVSRMEIDSISDQKRALRFFTHIHAFRLESSLGNVGLQYAHFFSICSLYKDIVFRYFCIFPKGNTISFRPRDKHTTYDCTKFNEMCNAMCLHN